MASFSNNVSVRLNNGSGSFSGTTNVGVGSLPVSVAVGDVDGDGDLDILTANYGSANVSVRLNQLTLATVNKANELEDRTVTFTSADFANALSGGSLTKIKITSLPASATGVLQLSGTPVTLNQEIPRDNIPNLTFVPAPNYNGAASFNWNGNDGTNYAASDASVNITLQPVNDAPSFTKGADQTVEEGAGAQTVPGWATNLSAGPNEAGQTLSFQVSTSSVALFSVQPAIDAGGTLTYTPAANGSGVATVRVTLKDNGGTANAGVDTSPEQVFTITITPAPVFSITDVTTVSCEALSAGQRRVSFTPRYAGQDGTPISFSVVNELAPTTNPGPYTLDLYTDNPVITLSAVQSGTTTQFAYNWLSACSSSTGNTPPTVANPVPPQSATVGIGYTLSLANVFTDAETPNALVLSVTGLPAGLSFSPPSTISGTPSMSGVSQVTRNGDRPGRDDGQHRLQPSRSIRRWVRPPPIGYLQHHRRADHQLRGPLGRAAPGYVQPPVRGLDGSTGELLGGQRTIADHGPRPLHAGSVHR